MQYIGNTTGEIGHENDLANHSNESEKTDFTKIINGNSQELPSVGVDIGVNSLSQSNHKGRENTWQRNSFEDDDDDDDDATTRHRTKREKVDLSHVQIRKLSSSRSKTKLKRRCSINGHYYNREVSYLGIFHGLTFVVLS